MIAWRNRPDMVASATPMELYSGCLEINRDVDHLEGRVLCHTINLGFRPLDAALQQCSNA